MLVAICVNVRGKVLILIKSSDLKRSKVNVNVGHPRKCIQLVFLCRCLPFGDCSVQIERIKKVEYFNGFMCNCARRNGKNREFGKLNGPSIKEWPNTDVPPRQDRT